MNTNNPYHASCASETPDSTTVGKTLIRAASFCGAICLTIVAAGILSVGLRRAIGAIGDASVVIPIAKFLVSTCVPYMAFVKMPQSHSVVTHALRPGVAGFFTVALPVCFIILFPSLNSFLYRSIAAIDIAKPFVDTIHGAVLAISAVFVVMSFPFIVDMVRKRVGHVVEPSGK